MFLIWACLKVIGPQILKFLPVNWIVYFFLDLSIPLFHFQCLYHNLFLKGSILQKAYSDSGLALDFYKNYDITFHSPKGYFGHVNDLDPEDFFLCDVADLEFRNAHMQYIP